MATEIPDISLADKKIISPQPWVEFNRGKLQLVHALDIEGVTIEGLLLRIIAFADFPEEAVTVQLEYSQAGRRDSAVDRINWRPLHTHENGNKGPAEYRLITIEGTHRHSFEHNWLTAEARLRKSNLPVAVPLNPEPDSFEALLAFLGECFRINGLRVIEHPPWREETLFSRRP